MLKDALREKSDIFNSDNPEEDKVYLLNHWLSVNTEASSTMCANVDEHHWLLEALETLD